MLRKIKCMIEERMPYNSFENPIFIISPPRAGSTFLFECLSQFDELFKFRAEADSVWWKYFDYRKRPDFSDFIGESDATEEKIRAVRKHIYQAVTLGRNNHIPKDSRPKYYFGLKRIRYLDKTIANCFHLEFIHRAFPGARYIFLLRDPRATISSMIEGWPHIDKFGKPQLNTIIKKMNSTVPHWTYPAPPGWQNVVTKPLPEICAWSWKQHIEYPLAFFEKLGKANEPTCVRYEEFISAPLRVVTELAEKMGLELTEKVIDFVTKAPLSGTTLTPPSNDKWKNHHHEIMEILPFIADTARKIGYDITTETPGSSWTSCK